jgi:hypothetical protein
MKPSTLAPTKTDTVIARLLNYFTPVCRSRAVRRLEAGEQGLPQR